MFRQCRFFSVRTITRSELIKDLYLKELKNYKAPTVKLSDAEGSVKEWKKPAVASQPAIEGENAAELEEYKSQSTEIKSAQHEANENWLEEK